jgi:hypothetical protein
MALTLDVPKTAILVIDKIRFDGFHGTDRGFQD